MGDIASVLKVVHPDAEAKYHLADADNRSTPNRPQITSKHRKETPDPAFRMMNAQVYEPSPLRHVFPPHGLSKRELHAAIEKEIADNTRRRQAYAKNQAAQAVQATRQSTHDWSESMIKICLATTHHVSASKEVAYGSLGLPSLPPPAGFSGDSSLPSVPTKPAERTHSVTLGSKPIATPMPNDSWDSSFITEL